MLDEASKLAVVFENAGTTQYKVPTYQRGYAWKKDQVDDFWNDIIEVEREPGYLHFYGQIFTTKDEADRDIVTIVDGQQRITTSALLLICARDIFYESKEEGVKKYYELMQRRLYTSKDGAELDKNSPLLTLSKVNMDLFEYLTKTDKKDMHTLKEFLVNDSNKKLYTAYKTILSNLKKIMKEDGIVAMNTLVSNMLRKFVIHIYYEKDTDMIYRIFHLMNDRGLSLDAPDLVKNYLFGMISKESYVDNYDIRWVTMRNRVTGKTGANAKLDRFFHHYLIAAGRYKIDYDEPKLKKHKKYMTRVPQRDVYKLFKILVEDMKQYPRDVIDELVSWSNKFYNIRKPSDSIFTNKDEIQHYLEKIKTTNAIFLYPVLLKGYEKYWEKNDKNSFEKLVKLCFIYHIRVKTVGTTIGLAEYETKMHEITNWIDNEKPINTIISDLMEESKYYPNDDKFRANLIDYTTADSKTAITLLEEIELTYSKKRSWPSVTLEHIMPQSFNKWWEEYKMINNLDESKKADWMRFHKEYKDRLGNLTLLSEPLNNNASDKTFTEKRVIYNKELSYHITTEVGKETEWTKDKIDARQNEFVNKLVERINLKKLLDE